jgi:hypothetical protein
VGPAKIQYTILLQKSFRSSKILRTAGAEDTKIFTVDSAHYDLMCLYPSSQNAVLE